MFIHPASSLISNTIEMASTLNKFSNYQGQIASLSILLNKAQADRFNGDNYVQLILLTEQLYPAGHTNIAKAKDLCSQFEQQNDQFADSAEATQFVEELQEMLNDKRLANWCKATDNNFLATTLSSLTDAQNAFAQVARQLDEAC